MIVRTEYPANVRRATEDETHPRLMLASVASRLLATPVSRLVLGTTSQPVLKHGPNISGGDTIARGQIE